MASNRRVQGQGQGQVQVHQEEPFPPTFTQLPDINEDITPGTFINVIAMVTDCRAPISTSGTDHKSTWSLKDISTQDDTTAGLTLNIFRPEKEMPHVSAGDVVVLQKVKVQRYQFTISLITHHSTAIRIYTASRIPKPPNSAKVALAPPARAKDGRFEPTDQINRYVSVFYHKIEEYNRPNEVEFKEQQEFSKHVKDKFSLLQDVKADSFVDIIVRVVRQPFYDHDYKATIYVSDYTENKAFHLQTWEGLNDTPGDPWGYTNSADASSSKGEWDGPDGKRSIQITVYPPHAKILFEDEITTGTWLHLRNVQIKYGRDGNFLEGFLREDQRHPTKINVSILDLDSGTSETVDPRLKASYQRWKASEREKKNVKKEIAKAKIAAESLKRKADQAALNDKESYAANTNERRKQQRGPKQKQISKAEEDQDVTAAVVQSEIKSQQQQITCESYYEHSTTIKSMLEPAYVNKEIDGQKVTVPLPFVNKKYQSHVRVVDFWPRCIQDFAVSRKQDTHAYLDSEHGESSSSSSSEKDENNNRNGRVWEWRFALELEDAPPVGSSSASSLSSPKSRVWVIVNNAAGQCLTDLDAADLRKKSAKLARLREKLAVLWGNLEEVKRHREQQANKPAAKRKSSRKGGKPGAPVFEKPTHASSDVEMDDNDGGTERELDNKPFMCCIQQYGVKDPKTQQWVRTFGLFGVKIKA